MKPFEIEFLHTDNSIRKIIMEAFNEERAVLRFYVNWSLDMKFLSIKNITKNRILMKSPVNFEGKDQKIVSYSEFEKILNSINLNWYGIKNWSRGDLDLFEEKLTGLTCEPVKNGMKIWDLNFDYSPLYK